MTLICYDVNTETKEGRTRLRKIAKACVNHGQRVQNSVFEVNIDYGKFLKLKHEIEKIMDKQQDSIRYYYLGNNYKNKIEHIGAKKKL